MKRFIDTAKTKFSSISGYIENKYAHHQGKIFVAFGITLPTATYIYGKYTTQEKYKLEQIYNQNRIINQNVIESKYIQEKIYNDIKQSKKIKIKPLTKDSPEYKSFLECISSGVKPIETCADQFDFYIKCQGDIEEIFDNQ